jgi:dipeptidyl-peptidase-4
VLDAEYKVFFTLGQINSNMGQRVWLVVFILSMGLNASAQRGSDIHWTSDGKGFTFLKNGGIVRMQVGSNSEETLVGREQLKVNGKALDVESYQFSDDGTQVMLFTNSAKVWRYNTRGDYWVYTFKGKTLRQLGKGRPSQSLMFAKFSPDGKKAAYVSMKNIYVEDLATGAVKALTNDGKDKMINGTFDWVYEEEFFCRDGFRWSPDSRRIAYWQVNATGTRDYYMINNTDSIYPIIIPVEYPKVGQPISKVRIGVVDITTAKTNWMNIPGEADKNYLVRMEWMKNGTGVIAQQLDRKQQVSTLYTCEATTGAARNIYQEKDAAWVDILAAWDQDYADGGWDWLNNGNEFIWSTEKDGWRHLYKVGIDGKEQLITTGNFDVMDIVNVDERNSKVYFLASPQDATSLYLYSATLDGKKVERISPANQYGSHKYKVSPGGLFAYHSFSNYYTPPVNEFISLPDHKGIGGNNRVDDALKRVDSTQSDIKFFTVKTADGVEMDGWMRKPKQMDPGKKYPIVFYVYTEPWGQTVKNSFGAADNFLYNGDMMADGYIYVSIDNRGTPVPKGRDWRKSVYRKIGLVNIRDQAMAARELLKLPYVDTSRVAVWGWSGGGSATLNLMFQYPEIYKTGISIAAVGNQLTYDNIYQERYMGPPAETLEDYVKGSPITYAKNLKGNLLYIHGTADDNVHYQNAELLLNELIKYNKIFQFMAYPNRTHSISEGEGTSVHLQTLYTNYLKTYCPPGGR